MQAAHCYWELLRCRTATAEVNKVLANHLRGPDRRKSVAVEPVRRMFKASL